MKGLCIELNQPTCFAEEYLVCCYQNQIQNPAQPDPEPSKMEFLTKIMNNFKLYTTTFASFILNN